MVDVKAGPQERLKNVERENTDPASEDVPAAT
jgi:hypothetical protein